MQANVNDGSPLSPLELDAWRGMLAVHTAVVRRLDADLRARHGLSVTSYEVLMLLGEAPRGRLRAARASHLAGVRREFLSRFGEDELREMAGFWARVEPSAVARD